ncbi:MAG: hypothetical protein U0W40_20190 [Acidimicrobiia bacterium]
MSKHKNFGVRTLQCEDEIAACAAAIGAAFAGNLALTTTSGPGLDLKAGALGLALMLELPLVLVDVQRGGPSTGLPTKTEQSDRCSRCTAATASRRCPSSPHSRRAAASTPHSRPYASRSSTARRCILLTDGYLANGAEPWRLPDIGALPDISVPFTTGEPRRRVLALPA